jgi:hypothetical protein
MGNHYLEAGDVVKRPKGIFEHQGIYLGNDRVFHNTPGRGEHVSSLQEFANGYPVSLKMAPSGNRSPLLARVYQAINNPRGYDPILNNCEHTVNRILEGTPRSRQLVGVGLFALLVAVLFVGSKS